MAARIEGEDPNPPRQQAQPRLSPLGGEAIGMAKKHAGAPSGPANL